MQLDQVTRRRLEQITAALAAEYDGVFSPASVERVVNDSLERLGAVTVTWHLPLLTERFAHQRLRAVAQAEGLLAKPHPVILFVCAHNAGRSQMAAALTRHLSQGAIEALSAGSDPAAAIDRAVVRVVAEIGGDLATVRTIRFDIANHVLDLLKELLQ